MATKWTVERLHDDILTPVSVTGLLFQPFWLKARVEYRQNHVLHVLTESR